MVLFSRIVIILEHISAEFVLLRTLVVDNQQLLQFIVKVITLSRLERILIILVVLFSRIVIVLEHRFKTLKENAKNADYVSSRSL